MNHFHRLTTENLDRLRSETADRDDRLRDSYLIATLAQRDMVVAHDIAPCRLVVLETQLHELRRGQANLLKSVDIEQTFQRV